MRYIFVNPIARSLCFLDNVGDASYNPGGFPKHEAGFPRNSKTQYDPL